MTDDTRTNAPVTRELVAQLQLDQLRVRLGLIPTLQPPTLDPDGRFVLLEVLGAGGMGVVFLGLDTTLDRHVALKVLRRRSLTPEQLEARLLREAKILANLQDRNILMVFDVGRARGGELFIATQYVPGETLREWQVGRPFADILASYVEAGRGLAAAHERDIVHRDFKPENVLLEPGPPVRVYVGDFGLADGPAQGEDDFAVHSRRAMLGTPAYMAPELLRQEQATKRSDQYAFCVALWEACTGSRPPSHPIPPQRPPIMPRWLYRLLLVGMSPRPDDRHASLASLLEKIVRESRGRRRALVTVSVFALLSMGVVAGYGYGVRPPDCVDIVAADGVWSAARGTALHAQIASFPAEYAPRTAESIVAALRANVEARHRLAATLCVERARTPKEDRLSRQADCLERWRVRTHTQIEALAELNATTFANARSLIEPLEAFAEICGRGDIPAPVDAEVRAAINHSENASLLLDHHSATKFADGAIELAQAHGRRCTSQGDASRELGYAHHQLGRAHMRAEQPEFARDELLAAIGHAQSCADEDLQIAIGVDLARLYALHLERIHAANLAIVEVRGKLGARDEPSVSTRRAELLEAEGFVALIERRPGDAIAAYRSALKALPDERPLHAAKLHSNIGVAHLENGDLANARASYEVAWTKTATTLGETHPEAQTHLRSIKLNEGLLAVEAGELDRAQQTLESLLEAPEPAIRVKALSGWLAIVFDGETTPAQLVRARELVEVLRDGSRLAPRIRAEGYTIAGHLLVGAADEDGFEFLRRGLALWIEHFPEDENASVAAIGLAQALHNFSHDDEARDACRMVRRLTVSLPTEVKAALLELEHELGM